MRSPVIRHERAVRAPGYCEQFPRHDPQLNGRDAKIDVDDGRERNKAKQNPGGSESEPYGIAITNDGEVWYSESGVKPSTLIKFDPKAGSFSREPIPSGGGVVRNMVATPDRRLYLACSGVNKVAVVDLNR